LPFSALSVSLLIVFRQMELREIKALLALMQEYGLTELELDDRKRGRLRLVRAAAVSAPVPEPAPAAALSRGGKTSRRPPRAAQGGDAAPIMENQRMVTSPMVGTFYRAPSPDAPPYVEEGTSVRKGQTLCIIEAMKMMNEIEAETPGRIVKVLCENAQPVEYGQHLMLLDLG
jgi:acetyl-CoA carboxylase biotin carboxyl carrier protein